MSDPLLKDTVLRVADTASFSVSANGDDVLLRPDGSVVELGADELVALEAFAIPRTLESGVRAARRRLPKGEPGDALALVLRLLERGLVVRSGAPTPVATAPPRQRNRAGFFGCPYVSHEDALAGPPGVIFFGARYDLGVTGREGARTGPSYLRKCSRTAFDYEERDGRALGWWDPVRGCRVLEGVPFRDIGDYTADTKRNGPLFDSLFDTERSILRRGHLPVAVGGDHSVSLPLITAAAQVHPGLGVVHFDAHADIGATGDMGNWRTQCTHGNFMSWVADNANVASIHQFGIRHLLPEPPFAPKNLRTYPGRAFLANLEQHLAELPSERPYYVTIDVDCLDPSVVSQTGTPIPGGLAYAELARSLAVLASTRRILAVDIVELIAPPTADDYREGVTVSYLLYELLAARFGPESAA